MAQKLRQIVDDLVQLCRRKPQHERAQILWDILGKFVVAGFQRLGQLHGDLVALVAGEPGRNAQQSAARPLTHHHRLADTDQVGEVGSDLHGAAQTAGGVPGQQLHIHHLDHPRGGGFQVVQQDIRDLLAAEGQHRLLRRNAAHTGIPVAQRRQRAARAPPAAAAPARRGADDSPAASGWPGRRIAAPPPAETAFCRGTGPARRRPPAPPAPPSAASAADSTACPSRSAPRRRPPRGATGSGTAAPTGTGPSPGARSFPAWRTPPAWR